MRNYLVPLIGLIALFFVFTFLTSSHTPTKVYQSANDQANQNIASSSAHQPTLVDNTANSLFEVGKSNIESSNSLLNNILQIATLVFTIILLIVGYTIKNAIDNSEQTKKIVRDTENIVSKMQDDLATQSTESSRINPATETRITMEELLTDIQEKVPNSDSLADYFNSQPNVKFVAFIAYRFEAIYRTIYNIQLQVLQALKFSSNHNLTKTYILDNIMRKEIGWDDSFFENYMLFLINEGLIEYIPADDEYKLTKFGDFFVQYLQASSIPFTKSG